VTHAFRHNPKGVSVTDDITVDADGDPLCDAARFAHDTGCCDGPPQQVWAGVSDIAAAGCAHHGGVLLASLGEGLVRRGPEGCDLTAINAALRAEELNPDVRVTIRFSDR
jgi:hypothetical protein